MKFFHKILHFASGRNWEEAFHSWDEGNSGMKIFAVECSWYFCYPNKEIELLVIQGGIIIPRERLSVFS